MRSNSDPITVSKIYFTGFITEIQNLPKKVFSFIYKYFTNSHVQANNYRLCFIIFMFYVRTLTFTQMKSDPENL